MPKNRRNTWHDIKTTNQKPDFFIFRHWGIIQCRKIISPLFQCARVDAFDACRYVHRFVLGLHELNKNSSHAKSSTDIIQMPGTWKNFFPAEGGRQDCQVRFHAGERLPNQALPAICQIYTFRCQKSSSPGKKFLSSIPRIAISEPYNVVGPHPKGLMFYFQQPTSE